MRRCLYCYQPLADNEPGFHGSCSRKIFGHPIAPELPWSNADIESLAKQLILSQTAVTGVQAKLSLQLTGNSKQSKRRRFTVAGLWTGYLLKPPSKNYPQLPEVEDLTMHLSQLARIKTAPHSLIPLACGKLAYVTKRMDRTKDGKLAMEDMCQLTGRLTEEKYLGSYEQVAKAIQKYSATPGLDVVNFFELLLFCFLTGNADMHLKNFSLLEQPGLGMTLSPAYDLVNTNLVNPADDEEFALTINGKKKKINKQDFVAAMNTLKVDQKQQQNIFNKMVKAMPGWIKHVDISFLSEAFKTSYKNIIRERYERLNL